jgi:hypothetical protein
MICVPQRGVRLSEWERGIGTAESTARTAQMITFPHKPESESVRERGKAQAPSGKARATDGARFSAVFETFRESLLSQPQ